MATVLKVTKADKTIHVVPIDNKAFYQHLNNRVLGKAEQMKLEEIDEDKAKDLPFIDESYVTGAEAQSKVISLEEKIAQLEAIIAKQGNGSQLDPASASRPYAAEPPATSQMSVDEFTKQLKEKGEVTQFQSPAGDTTGKVEMEGAVFTQHHVSAKDLIAAIKEANTTDEVNALSNGDTRKTVQDAAADRLEELNKA